MTLSYIGTTYSLTTSGPTANACTFASISLKGSPESKTLSSMTAMCCCRSTSLRSWKRRQRASTDRAAGPLSSRSRGQPDMGEWVVATWRGKRTAEEVECFDNVFKVGDVHLLGEELHDI